MDVSRIVVPELSIWNANRWMRGERAMTTFTAGTARRIDADVEAWVAPRATIGRLGVTGLAVEHAVGE
jgi:hypothetical protein